jgi:lysophospholipase L1-like esterase
MLFLPWSTELQATNAPAGLRIKRAVSRSLGVPLVDMTPDLRPELYLEADPVHPDAAGNQIIAGKLFETLTNLVSP